MSAFSSATVAGAEAVSGTGKKSSSSKVFSTRISSESVFTRVVCLVDSLMKMYHSPCSGSFLYEAD